MISSKKKTRKAGKKNLDGLLFAIGTPPLLHTHKGGPTYRYGSNKRPRLA